MKLKGLVETDFVNYKKTSMFLITSQCDFKCDKECGKDVCQNSPLAKAAVHEIDNQKLIQSYINNPLTEAIVIGGLEPFDTWEDTFQFIKDVRNYYIEDDIVIYTGYTQEEVFERLVELSNFHAGNIVIKYGRFRPNSEGIYDRILGIKLSSKNQYGVRYTF